MEDGFDCKVWICVVCGSRFRSKYKVGLELICFSLCFDKEFKGVKVKVECGNLLYQEFDSRDKIFVEIIVFGVQIMEVFYQLVVVGFEKGNCVLVSVSDIVVRWEFDVYLFFYEVGF